jgi:hypothetical protein
MRRNRIEGSDASALGLLLGLSVCLPLTCAGCTAGDPRVLARQGSGAGRAVTRRFFCDSVLFGAVLPTIGSVGSHSELLMRFAIDETRDACFFFVVHSR